MNTENTFTITDEQLLELWKDIWHGKDSHGDFLRSFGETLVRADAENFQLLRPVALSLIAKYKLV